MRQFRTAISMSVLVLSVLACNAVSGLGKGLRTAQTEIPAMMTAAPTALESLATAAAEFTPPVIPTNEAGENQSNPSSGLGIALDDVRSVMEATQQFTFTDGSVDGKTAVVAKLSASAASSMPAMADKFAAYFIGDAANLSEIKIEMPYLEDQSGVDTGLSLMTVLFAGILPPDVLLKFVPWISENYSKLPVGGSEELSAGNMKFILSRTQSIVQLDILPTK